MAMRSGPRIGAAISGDPRPFWIVCTTVSGPSSGAHDFAAASTSNALVAMITRSQGPMPSVVVEAWIGTVRSPLAPSQRRPWARIASA